MTVESLLKSDQRSQLDKTTRPNGYNTVFELSTRPTNYYSRETNTKMSVWKFGYFE